METKFERVYALGDVVSIPLKLGKPLPKAGVFAHADWHIGKVWFEKNWLWRWF